MALLRWVPHRGRLPELPAFPGTPVLLLHGLMGSPGNFGPTAQALIADRVPVIAPLYGRRGTVPVADSFAELLDVTVPLLEVHERIDVVGHSLGGHLGLRLAHEFPGRVRTLVGVGACFRGLPPPPRRIVRHAAPLLLGRGVADLMTPVPLEVTVPEGTRVVSVISDADVVVPRDSSLLGEVLDIHGVRHEHLPSQAGPILTALAWTP